MAARHQRPGSILLVLLAYALMLTGCSQAVRADDDERFTVYMPRVDAGAGLEAKPHGQLVIGDDGICRLDEEGQLICWAWGTTERVPGLPGKYQHISIGEEGLCGVRLDGHILCDWFYGLGAWSAPPGRYTLVGVAGISACALRSDGTIACWRLEGFWEGSGGPRAFPGPSGEYQQLAVSDDVVCGLAADQTLRCSYWREGGPEWPGPSGGIAQIELSFRPAEMALLLRNDGSVLWWNLESGAIEDGPEGTFRQISWRSWPACALDSQGEIQCWEGKDQPVHAPSGVFRSIHTGSGGLCAIGDSGPPACWEWMPDGTLEPLPVP